MFNPPNMDLSALSVDQLREMEGQERENVEARVRVLRNVHSLLDAVIVQLDQYSNVINHLKWAFYLIFKNLQIFFVFFIDMQSPLDKWNFR